MVVELTNRCNLNCRHCFEERHAGTGDLPLDLVEKVLREGHSCEVEHFSFTGGEPTLHRHFCDIVRQLCDAGYSFSFVSNGSTFPHIYPLLLEHQRWFRGVTFSLDGARERTHDRLRGPGSYRQVMRAASICVSRGLPFTFNMVVTAENRGEIEEMTELASRLASGGLRFGHLMPGEEVTGHRLGLSPEQRREIEREIWRLRTTASIPIGMAPGYYSASLFFPCGPLELQEFNLDYRGNLTLCCQLSGYRWARHSADVIGSLNHMSLKEACLAFEEKVKSYLADKRQRFEKGELGDLDHFPCHYCVKYLNEVRPLHKHASPLKAKGG